MAMLSVLDQLNAACELECLNKEPISFIIIQHKHSQATQGEFEQVYKIIIIIFYRITITRILRIYSQPCQNESCVLTIFQHDFQYSASNILTQLSVSTPLIAIILLSFTTVCRTE